MSPQTAQRTRRRIRAEQAAITKLGALQAVTFLGVGSAGPDIYRVTFAQGVLE